MAKSIGLIPYEDETKPQRFPKLMKWIFIILLVNLNLVWFSEIIFVVLSIIQGENFIESTMNLSYVGPIFVCNIKMFSVLQKKPLLTLLMQEVRAMYPEDVKLQEALDARGYVRRFNLKSFGFVIIHEICLWTYNLHMAMSYLIYDFWLQKKIVPIILPFNAWIPWQWKGNWSYYFLYASQNLAGYTCMSAQLTSDLLLCVVATQIIMHFRYLAQRIESYEPAENYENNKEFLSDCIRYHQKILDLSVYMNEVFGVSLLVNFISSSFVMCFLGFLMTVGVQADILIMLFMFMCCSLVQILMICNYGEQLIVKSEGIGHAIYNHNWLHTDVRYRKMLILIIERSQKPALLKATTFLNVSMGTMTDLMQLSYKFFALLRTIYSK